MTSVKCHNKVICYNSNSINVYTFFGMYDSSGYVCVYKFNKVNNK